MKIIDNKKDYYDYLASFYGIDELIIFDRRGSVVLNTECGSLKGMDYYFSQKILSDKPLSNKHYWNLNSIAKIREAENARHLYSKTWKEGDVYHFILEVGYSHYRFEVERWIEDNKDKFAHVETTLIDVVKNVRERYSEVPICLVPCQTQFLHWSHEERWKEDKRSLIHRVENPILAGTFITKIIAPSDIWQALYEYLSSLRDKPFTDTRSDVQKLESAGFDKKTSFRNVKSK